MYYGEIKDNDIANGIGIRVTLFVSGCTNHCKECFQPETWDFEYGQPFTEETEATIMEMLAKKHIDGFTLLGGEPFEPKNQRRLVDLLKGIKEKFPEKSIWSFSGFTLEELLDPEGYANCEVTKEMLSLIDVLVDGRYDADLRDLSLRFRGSRNQRIIDLKKTFSEGEIVLWDD